MGFVTIAVRDENFIQLSEPLSSGGGLQMRHPNLAISNISAGDSKTQCTLDVPSTYLGSTLGLGLNQTSNLAAGSPY